MPTYKFTEKAEADLASIVEYTQEAWGTAQALRYIDGFHDLANALSIAPEMGVNRDNILTGLCVFPYEKHLLFYQKAPHGITVVRVLHKSMDVQQHFDR